MREILFRGQKFGTKEWVHGDLIQCGSEMYILEQKINSISKNASLSGYWNINSPCFKVIPETVGQFTGLTDKNGVKIFEGDDIFCDMSFDGGVLPHAGEIVYLEKYGAFATKNQGGETLLHNHLLSSFEVIGSIHENK